MTAWKWFLLSFFGGGIAFWISDLIIPAFDRNEQGYAVTLACPIVLVAFYFVIHRIRKGEPSGPSTALFALCGMWILALSFTLLAQRIRGGSGGEFGLGDFGYIFVSSFVPTRIIEFLALEGSVLALAIGTAAMIVCQIKFERNRWIIPPSVWAVVRHAKQ